MISCLIPHRVVRRRAIGLFLAGAAAVLPRALAHAEAQGLVADVSTVQSGYSYTGHCESLGDVTADLHSLAVPIRAEGDAVAGNAAVGVGTTVTCIIEDGVSGTRYGTVSDGLPGPDAEVVGVVTIPQGANPVACVGGAATFSDGGSISADPTQHCGQVVVPSLPNIHVPSCFRICPPPTAPARDVRIVMTP